MGQGASTLYNTSNIWGEKHSLCTINNANINKITADRVLQELYSPPCSRVQKFTTAIINWKALQVISGLPFSSCQHTTVTRAIHGSRRRHANYAPTRNPTIKYKTSRQTGEWRRFSFRGFPRTLEFIRKLFTLSSVSFCGGVTIFPPQHEGR